MQVGNTLNTYTTNSLKSSTSKTTNIKDYSNYLTQKFSCLTPGNNASVSVTSGLLRKAMSDEKTASWLERELAKAPDYIEAAQRSAIAHGATLKSVTIEFGEEYSTMTTLTVTDGGGTDSDIDKWLERVKEKREKQKEAEKKLEKKHEAERIKEASVTEEFRGKDLDDLISQFSTKMSGTLDLLSDVTFDVRG